MNSRNLMAIYLAVLAAIIFPASVAVGVFSGGGGVLGAMAWSGFIVAFELCIGALVVAEESQ